MVNFGVIVYLSGVFGLSRAGLISLKPRSSQNVTSRCEENSKSPVTCRNINPGTALQHPDDCHLFYYCEQPYLPAVCKECPENLLFNPVINVCDWHEYVDCQVGDLTTESKVTWKPQTAATTDKTSQTILKLTPEKEESIVKTRCESNSRSPVSCTTVHGTGALVPHPDDCQLFYSCVAPDVEPVCKQCPHNLHFNPVTQVCDWPAAAGCNKTDIVTFTPPSTWAPVTVTNLSQIPDQVTESTTAKAADISKSVPLTPKKDSEDSEAGLSRCELNLKSPVSCNEVHSAGGLVPHPDDCQLFYYCVAPDSAPVCKQCPHNLHFNPASQVCDWPDLAGCNKTDIVTSTPPSTWAPVTVTKISQIPDQVTESTTAKAADISKSVPLTPKKDSEDSEAGLSRCELNLKSPVSCNEVHSAGGLVPHPDDCQLFYYCVAPDSAPVCKQCPHNLHFNPASQVCDWPDLAGCNKTDIVTSTPPSTWAPVTVTNLSQIPDQVTKSTTAKAADISKSVPLTPKKDSEDSEAGLSRCELNLKSPVSCNEVHSAGGLVPHPDDCQLFYYCVAPDSAPVCKQCPHNLHFNPASQVCDWPDLAGCNKTDIVTSTPPSTWAPVTVTKISQIPDQVTESTTAKAADISKSVPLTPKKDSEDSEAGLSRCELNLKSPVSCNEVHGAGGLVPHPDDCQLFYYCVTPDSAPVCKQCPHNLNFNPASQVCDWLDLAGCNKTGIVTSTPPSTWAPVTVTKLSQMPDQVTESTTAKAADISKSVPLTPKKDSEESEAGLSRCELNSKTPVSCAGVNITDSLVSHPDDCQLFYYCVAPDLKPVCKQCPDNLHFNKAINVCDWPEHAGCKGNNQKAELTTTWKPQLATKASTDSASNTKVTSKTDKKPETATNLTPEKEESIVITRCESNSKTLVSCATVQSPGALIPHPDDCQLFYSCVAPDIEPVCKQCPHNLHFNSATQVCDWPTTAGCNITKNTEATNAVIVKPIPPTTWAPVTVTNLSPTPQQVTESTTTKAAAISTSVPLTPKKDSEDSEEGLSRCELNSKNPVSCAEVNSTDSLVPHPDDCQLFYYCLASDTAPVCKQCPHNLHFNSASQVCDWPALAGCDINVVTSTPSTTWAPVTDTNLSQIPQQVTESTVKKAEATSKTVPLIAKNDAITMPSENIADTTLTPEVITDSTDSMTSQTDGNVDTQQLGIPIRCEKNSKTAVSCVNYRGLDSLVPHPDDCQLFYYCVDPSLPPICRQCPANLHFNPSLHVCDWPARAGCTITATGDSTTLVTVSNTIVKSTISTVSIMPEKVTESSTTKASPTTETVSLTPMKDTEATEKSSTEISTSTNKPLNLCELNSRSTVSCAEINSPDALVPHPDDCQLFYYCEASDKEPVCKQCPHNLHFNPASHVCDWPATAGCNITTESDPSTWTMLSTTQPTTWAPATLSTESSQTEIVTESSTSKASLTTEGVSLAPEKDSVTTAASVKDTGATEISSTATSTSTNKPLNLCELNSKSPVSCAEVHSPDALVPHPDDCQLFYYCEASDKKPICKQCPHNLHFNPVSHVCDWPATAGCNITANTDSITWTNVLTTVPATWTPSTISTEALLTEIVTELSTTKATQSTEGVSHTTEGVPLAPEKDLVTPATSVKDTEATEKSSTEISTSTNKPLNLCELNSRSTVSCAEINSPDALVPHPDDCRLFYYCVAPDITPICKQCPNNLHFNPASHVCDWPATAGCNVTVKTDSTPWSTLLTTLPTTLTPATISTASLPTEKVTELSTTKASPATEGVSLAPEKDSVTTAASVKDTEATEISNTVTSTSTNKPLNLCELNSKSPVSCAEVHSPDALVPHPDDCQLFYYCEASDKEPVCKQCPHKLHFNPASHVCDWPATAGCNITAKSDPSTWTTLPTTLPTTWTPATLSTESLQTEIVTESYYSKAPQTTEGVSLAPEKDSVTTAASVKDTEATEISSTATSTSTNKPLSLCELNSKSPVSCAEVHSPDALVPHPDDCQLFYYCEASDKKPICKQCPHNLHFNPVSHVCDWPATAGCNVTANTDSTTWTTVLTTVPATWTPSTISTEALLTEIVTELSTTKATQSTEGVSHTTERVSLAPEKDFVTPATSVKDTEATEKSSTEISTSTNKPLNLCELDSKSTVSCAEVNSPDALVPHPDHCQLFYYCVAPDITPICKQCPDNLHFNPASHVCDWPATAGCNVTVKTDSTPWSTLLTTLPTTLTPTTISTVSLPTEEVTELSTTKASPATEGVSLAPEKDSVTTAASVKDTEATEISNIVTSTSTNKPLNLCELNSKSPVSCAEVHSPDALVPHPDDCQLFYYCEASDKEPVCKQCPHNLHFNPASHVCDWPATAGCNITAKSDPSTWTTLPTTLPTTWTPATLSTESSQTEIVTESSTSKAPQTTEGVSLAPEKDSVTTAASVKDTEATEISSTATSTSTNKPLSLCELNSKSPVSCAEVHSPDALVPHPDDCQLFYYCEASDKKPICKQCPHNLHFNPVSHVCDWPATAGCNVTANTDSTTWTTVLTTVPATWTPSTILTEALLTEIVTELSTTKATQSTEGVSHTTERVSLAPEKDFVTPATSVKDTEATEKSSTEISTSNNKPLNLCELNSRSTVSCAEINSTDALVPHPDDCRLFYYCVAPDIAPICKQCPDNLHFNPASHVCDWPATAGCNVTVKTDSTPWSTLLTTLPTTLTAATISTVSLPTEKVTELFTAKASQATEGVSLAPEKDSVTTAASVKDTEATETSNTATSTSTNKPLNLCELNSKSPISCAEVHSSDALVPHPDDCQLFYYCEASDKKPICKQCPHNLHFNPVSHVCDWPATAGCNVTANTDSTTWTPVLTTVSTTWTPSAISTEALLTEIVTELSTTKATQSTEGVSHTTEGVSLAPEKDSVTTATPVKDTEATEKSSTEISTSSNKPQNLCELHSRSTVSCADINSPDALVPHPDDCQLFYYCVAPDITPICKQCPDNLHFNPASHVCDWPATAGCNLTAKTDSTKRTTETFVASTPHTIIKPTSHSDSTITWIPEGLRSQSLTLTTESAILRAPKSKNGSSMLRRVTESLVNLVKDSDESEKEVSTSSNKPLTLCEGFSRSPVSCAEIHSPAGLLPHPDDCQLFYYCVAPDVEPICKQCPNNLHFNPASLVCDWPSTAGCNITKKSDSATTWATGITATFTQQQTTKWIPNFASTTPWAPTTFETVTPEPPKAQEINKRVSLIPEKDNEPTTTRLTRCELNSKSPVSCDEVHNQYGVIAHPDDCQLFYYCVASQPICKQCPDNLHFNPDLLVCDWPATAGCNITTTTSATDSPKTTTPALWLLGSKDKLTWGLNTNDAIANSNAGDTLMPETGSTAKFIIETSTSWVPDKIIAANKNNITTLCERHSKTPVSCADASPNTLLPHPDDCQLFYSCLNQDLPPVCRECPAKLHFNPKIQACDWPGPSVCKI